MTSQNSWALQLLTDVNQVVLNSAFVQRLFLASDCVQVSPCCIRMMYEGLRK